MELHKERWGERPLLLSDPVVRDGEFSCRIQHHSNVAMTLSWSTGQSWDPDPRHGISSATILELQGFPQQDVFVHVLCHQNVFVFVLTATKKPQNKPQTHNSVAQGPIYCLSLLRTYGSTFLGCWSPGLMTSDQMAQSKE